MRRSSGMRWEKRRIPASAKHRAVLLAAFTALLLCASAVSQKNDRPVLISTSPQRSTIKADSFRVSAGDTLLIAVPLQTEETDTLGSIPSQTLIDTVSAETAKSGVDTLVTYSAKDSIAYSMGTRLMRLYGKAETKYRSIGLEAERVVVNWDTGTLFAEGVVDTADTTKKSYIGLPVMKDGGETYKGFKIAYNFRTQKGKIDLGETEIEQGYYHGEEIKKIDTDVLFVADGRYTTCDASHPHYYFFSPKMKIVLRDHIVAEPIYLHIADVPVFALPFGVFPNKAGRRSGIIAPAYGEDNRRGFYLSHFGYYWAINDYFDFSSTFDWYARGGWLNRSMFRYALRYNFTGSINASVTSLHVGELGDPARTETRDYNVRINHNQQIDPTTRADVNFIFSTGSYFRNFSSNLDEILRQNIVSNATLSKTWEGSNRNLTFNVYRDQDLITGSVQERFPSLTFTQGQFYPFRRKVKGREASEESAEMNWYEMIGMSYSAQGEFNRKKRVETIKDQPDSVQTETTRTTREENVGANHDVGINISPKAGYFTISPFFRYNEKWYNKSVARDRTGTREVKGFNAVRTFSSGVSASTRFFGMFQPQVFGITGIRHTVTPSLSYSYQPDFSDERFGYFGSFKDTSGRSVKYDRFAGFLYGGTPAGEQQSLSFNVGNIFEMKYLSSDTAKQEQKVQLMNVNGGLSYNLAADSLRLSELGISYRTQIGNLLSLTAFTSYNFYVFDPLAQQRVNRYLISEKGYLADLTSFSFSVSTSLSGERKSSSTQTSVPESVKEEQERVAGQIGIPTQNNTSQGLFQEGEPDFDIPWNLSLSYSFSQNQSDPRRKDRSSTLQASLSFSLTQSWKVSTNGNYDFVRKEFSAPFVNVSRDLHCWIMNFTWAPIGFYSYYKLEIRVKAPQLQDLKIEKQGSARGTYY